MNEKHISRGGQISVYLGKCFRTFQNERGWKNLVSTLLITLLISAVTGEDIFVTFGATQNGAFALVCACIWVGIFNSIRSVCRERDILKREHRAGLHMSSYVIAHLIFEACICFTEAFLVLIVVRIVNWDNFPKEAVLMPPALEMFITFFLIIFSADAMGLLISAVVKNENTAMTVMPFALIIQLVMSGTVFELEGVTEFVSKFTISRWGLAAICSISNVNDMTFYFVEEYSSTVQTIFRQWGILLIFAAVYGILSVISLQFVDRDSR